MTAPRKTLSARTPVELLDKVYKAEGWTRKPGESKVKRATQFYKLRIRGDRYVAEPKD